MAHNDNETTLVLNRIFTVASKFNLIFDGPGTSNWRRRKGEYHIYFRAVNTKGNPTLKELWVSKGNRMDSELSKELSKHFSAVKFEGGCADLGASYKVKI